MIFDRLFYYFGKRAAIKRALGCKGWTSDKKLSVLYDIAHQTSSLSGDILEIGSAWGRSTILLGYASIKHIWSIDPHTGGRAFVESGETQDSFEIFQDNLVTHGLENRVKILKHTTEEVLEKKLLPKALRLSMVFIDGMHTAEGVEIDFGLAYERLEPNGIIVFDDYFEKSVPDYTAIIDELMQRCGLILFKDKGSGLVHFVKTVG